MIKILVIFTCPFCNDGISNNVMNYFRFIDHSIIHADFVANNEDVPEKWKKQISCFGGELVIIKSRNSHPLKYSRELTTLIKKNKYDIVHAHGNSATLFVEMNAARKAKCRIRISHSRNTKCDHKLIDRLLRPFFYKSYTDAFACGEAAGKWLFKNRHYTVIRNGNDLKKNQFNPFMRDTIRKRYNISKDTIVLIHVGFFVPQKNHDFLLRMFSLLSKNINKNYFLFLIGVGPEMEKDQEYVNQQGIMDKVLFLGNRDDVPDLLSASDVFVFPSLFEGMPNALIEAEISGLYCLTSDNVTRDVNITGDVRFIPILESSERLWIDKISEFKSIDRVRYCEENISKFIVNGYDIEENAKVLQKKYLELYEKN